MKDIRIVSSLEEAAREGYRQGFDEGYAAARVTIETVVDAWRKEPWAYDLEGALKALDLARDKVRERLGTPEFTATRVKNAAPGGRQIH